MARAERTGRRRRNHIRRDLCTEEEFEAISAAFGPLPRRGKQRLLKRLRSIGASYLLDRQLYDKPAPSTVRNKLESIESAAGELQRLLVDARTAESDEVRRAGVRSMPDELRRSLWKAIEHEASHREPNNKPDENFFDSYFPPIEFYHPDADIVRWYQGESRLDAILLGLRILRQASKTAHDLAAEEVQSGRGGARNPGKQAQRSLFEMLFKLYAELRRRYRDSGPPPGISYDAIQHTYGGPMLRFVRACLVPLVRRDNSLGDMTDTAIRSRYREWKKSNPGTL